MDFMDERMGVPSSSSMPRIMCCLGSFNMERNLEDSGSRAAANRGTRIHDVLGLKMPMQNLSHSDQICAERCMFEEGRLVEKFGLEGAHQTREKRFYLKTNGRVYHTGKPDVVYVLGKKMLVVNYKTGFHAPENPSINWQCVSESILASDGMKNMSVTAALIHPNAPVRGDISQAYAYSKKQLEEYKFRLETACKEAIKPEACRVPGQHCRWCRAAKHRVCPEYVEYNPE